MTAPSFVQSIDQHLTQEFIAEQGRGDPPVRPVMSLLLEFAEERLNRAVLQEDWLKGLTAMLDLQTALSALVTWGHAEFEPTLQQIDGELRFFADACRHKLMVDYLDTRSEERAAELHGMLLDLGQSGYWSSWREDLDNELWAGDGHDRQAQARAGLLTMRVWSELDLRLRLHRCGYDPLPLVDKACYLHGWRTKTNTNAAEIALWSSLYRDAKNSGIVCTRTPVLDIDILNPEAAAAAEQLVRERFEGHGTILVRVGLAPKRAIPFKTDAPFGKTKVLLTAPNDAEEKIELLADGQMVAVAGIHPDTRQPYRWFGGELWTVPRDDLPAIREAEAEALVNDVVAVLRDYGYRRAVPPKPAPKPIAPATKRISEAFGVSAGGGVGGKSWLEGGAIGWQAEWEAPKGLYKLAARVTKCPQHKRRVLGGLRELVEARVGRNELLHSKAVLFRTELIREGVVSEAAAEALLLVAARCCGYIAKDGIDEATRTVRSGLGLERADQ
jgi:hypothetical protein